MVTLEGNRLDIERLLEQSSERLTATGLSREVVLEVIDGDNDVAIGNERHAGRALIEVAVRHLNGFGKLRWGRAFEGVEVKNVKYFDSEGRSGGQVVFVGTAYDHMLPEDYADMMERFGHTRPALPEGVE